MGQRLMERRPACRVFVVLAVSVCAAVVFGAAASPAAAAPMCGRFEATIVGTRGADQIVGTSGNDIIVARGGADQIQGRGGLDLICAGRGSDQVSGGRGNDVLFAGKGADDLFGGRGDDGLRGGSGFDLGSGGPGGDCASPLSSCVIANNVGRLPESSERRPSSFTVVTELVSPSPHIGDYFRVLQPTSARGRTPF